MNRSVVTAAFVVAVVLGVALFVYRRSFGDDAVTKDIPGVAGADAGVVATGPDPVGAGADGGTGPAVDVKATVAAARGTVQVKSVGGEWRDVQAGEVLKATDAVRAGRSSEATLQMGGGVTVRLSPRSEFTLRELSDDLSRIRLEVGHVTASVDESGKRVLRVEATGSDAVAESKGGEFGIVSDGKGQLAVATTTGSVKLTAGGKTVDIDAGLASTVAAGGAPSDPSAIPGSLFLKVQGGGQKTNQTSATVAGTTAPGSLVRVNDEVAAVDARGRFQVKVALKDGANNVAVEVQDASGRARAETLAPIVVDREKPRIDADVKWGQ